MLKLRIALTLVCTICLAAAGWMIWNALRPASPAELAAWRQQLTVEDPQQRLAAADGLLRGEPTNPDLLFARANALVDLGRFDTARQDLTVLTEKSWPRQREALELFIEALLRDGSMAVSTASPHALALAEQRVETVAGDAATVIQAFEKLGGAAVTAAEARARIASLHARMARHRLDATRIERDKAGASGAGEEAQLMDLETEQQAAATTVAEAALLKACDDLLALDPSSAWAFELRFNLYFDSARFADARTVAASMLEAPNLPGRLAGAVAMKLINLDMRFSLVTQPQDLELAGALLAHPGLTGETSIEQRLATVALQLARGESDAAATGARALLETYPGHPRATAFLGLALTQQQRYAEAVDVVSRVPRSTSGAFARYVAGRALIEQGDATGVLDGVSMLQAALELDRQLLPAHLMLAETHVRFGRLMDARQAIAAAVRLHPDHPRVEAVRARLMIEAMDLVGLRDAILAQVDRPGSPLTPADVRLVVRMALDDDVAVRALVQERRQAQVYDTLTRLAEGWLDASILRRQEVAGLACRTLEQWLHRDPLSLLDGPTVLAITQPHAAHSGEMIDPEADAGGSSRDDLDALTHSRFVRWFEEEAADLLAAARGVWPQDPSLLAEAVLVELWLGRTEQAMAMRRQAGQTVSQPTLDSLLTRMAGAGADGAAEPTDWPGEAEASLWALATAVHGDPAGLPTAAAALANRHVWAGPPLLWAMRMMMLDRPDHDLEPMLVAVDGTQAALGRVMRGRLDLARGDPEKAVESVKPPVPEDGTARLEPGRRFALEVEVRSFLMRDRPTLAVGLLDRATVATEAERTGMQLAAADALSEAGSHLMAADRLSAMLAEPQMAAYWQDRVLVRAVATLQPDRMRSLIQNRLLMSRNQPLLLLHRAELDLMHGRLTDAQNDLAELLELRPGAPRAQWLRVQVLQRMGKVDAMMAELDAIMQQGGPIAARAQQQIERMFSQPEEESATNNGAQP